MRHIHNIINVTSGRRGRRGRVHLQDGCMSTYLINVDQLLSFKFHS